VLTSDHFLGGPRISPDGRWLAYLSGESGRAEVYIRPFPNVESARWQVSVNGGGLPRWSPDARELFYVDFPGDLIAVEVGPDETFTAGRQRALFSTREYRTLRGAFDVLPDGSGFMMIRENRGGTVEDLVAVEHFTADLERRVGR
jgi:serine/threonine-protein kinase